jgi:hypothetical protein
MTKRRKNKGYKLNYSGFHHNFSNKSGIWQPPSLGCFVPVKLSNRQIEAMDRIVFTHEHFTGEAPSLKQIDLLDLVFRKALVEAETKQSQVLEVSWLDWTYHINFAWYLEGCPPSGLLRGLRMTAITARGSRINTSFIGKEV